MSCISELVSAKAPVSTRFAISIRRTSRCSISLARPICSLSFVLDFGRLAAFLGIQSLRGEIRRDCKMSFSKRHFLIRQPVTDPLVRLVALEFEPDDALIRAPRFLSLCR